MQHLPPSEEAVRRSTQRWLHAANAVGKTEAELISAAADHGIEVRVLARDGEHFGRRTDLRPKRINVEVVDGRIALVTDIG